MEEVSWSTYRKTATVDAVQLTDEVIMEIASHPKLGMFHLPPNAEHDYGLSVQTEEGRLRAEPGDYLCRGVEGEMWPVSEDIFERTYEQVDHGQGEP